MDTTRARVLSRTASPPAASLAPSPSSSCLPACKRTPQRGRVGGIRVGGAQAHNDPAAFQQPNHPPARPPPAPPSPPLSSSPG